MPVIAIGVPTVVNAMTIAFELFNQAMQNDPQLADLLPGRYSYSRRSIKFWVPLAAISLSPRKKSMN
ncbi:MAG: hypothetical protein ACOX37_03920 [Bacillota bacterium]